MVIAVAINLTGQIKKKLINSTMLNNINLKMFNFANVVPLQIVSSVYNIEKKSYAKYSVGQDIGKEKIN